MGVASSSPLTPPPPRSSILPIGFCSFVFHLRSPRSWILDQQRSPTQAPCSVAHVPMPAHPPGRVLCAEVPPSHVPLFLSSQSSTTGPWPVRRTYPCRWSSLFLLSSSARPSTWTGTSRSDCARPLRAARARIPLNPRATLFYSPLPAPKVSLRSSCSRLSSSSSLLYPSFVSQEARQSRTNGIILFLGEGAATTTSTPRRKYQLCRR